MTEAKPDEQNREFAVQRVYTKDVSFETPNSPAVFQQEWKPETGVNLNTEVNKLSDTLFEVTLTVTVTTKVGEKTAYLVEVKQAGIFAANGFPEQEMGPLLGAYCPNQLFPYAREVISDVIMKGSFPQMVLEPVNFDLLYAQHQQELAKKAQSQSEAQH
ncbi:MAG: protein-export chaperone SecB [Candidatus Thiodiazotropha sp. (ex Ustalcina ferruginea)]|nr:protein-export chaperone SecB [Candidatus Thiodiazotropha sp. (ex Ustalcina ferruginea)]